MSALREALHIALVAYTITAVTAFTLFLLALGTGLVMISRDTRRPRRKHRARSLPLFLLRARTWRKRRRNHHCTYLADALACPLTSDEKRALDEMERKLR